MGSCLLLSLSRHGNHSVIPPCLGHCPSHALQHSVNDKVTGAITDQPEGITMLSSGRRCIIMSGNEVTHILMTNSRSLLKSGLQTGVKRGGRSFLWICRIVIPVSLLTTLLQWTGWLDRIAFLFDPLMSFLNLPSQAALPIISGMLTNIYVAIAAMTAIPFTVEQMTLIAIFNLICHNLITEGIIQHKSGISVIKITLIRIAAAILAVLVCSQVLGDTDQMILATAPVTDTGPLLPTIRDWGMNFIALLLRILGIVMAVMIMQELSESLGWTKHLVRAFLPLMRVLGLSEQSSNLWVTSAAFGLMYGGAVTIDKVRKGTLSKNELERLHISIGINHGLIEDPALFLALALNPLWLWGPKLLTAIVAVQIYRAVQHLRAKLLR